CGSDMKLRQCVEQRLRECEKDLAISNLPHPRPAVTVAHHSSSDSAGGNGFSAAYETAPLGPPARMGAGRYRPLEPIADGGMGTVWKAEQREPMVRDVAVKLIRPELADRGMVARFEAERQALAMMNHDNIAKVYDGGTDEGHPFFVMEYVPGESLTEYCDGRRLRIPARLELMIQVCQAVQHAHQKLIIHRDLKPSNILVKEEAGHAVPKVIDFGLAKALQGSHVLTDKTLITRRGSVIGTLPYMAPEQMGVSSLDVDTRTDVYALGAVLYELLT